MNNNTLLKDKQRYQPLRKTAETATSPAFEV